MTDKEREVFLKTKLRNLKREYAKVIQHPDLTEHAIDLKAEIDGIERELNSQWTYPHFFTMTKKTYIGPITLFFDDKPTVE